MIRIKSMKKFLVMIGLLLSCQQVTAMDAVDTVFTAVHTTNGWYKFGFCVFMELFLLSSSPHKEQANKLIHEMQGEDDEYTAQRKINTIKRNLKHSRAVEIENSLYAIDPWIRGTLIVHEIFCRQYRDVRCVHTTLFMAMIMNFFAIVVAHSYAEKDYQRAKKIAEQYSSTDALQAP